MANRLVSRPRSSDGPTADSGPLMWTIVRTNNFFHIYSERLSMDYLWAGLCLLGAVFFLFRAKIFGAY